MFIYPMLAASILYFVVTGIQFWFSDYMLEALKVHPDKVYLAFALVSTTSPTLGVIIGGIVTNCIGGYNSPLALPLCMISGSLACLFGIPIPFIKDFYVFIIFLWIQLFFGSFLLPSITGLMISSAPKRHKAIANSFAFISYNLIGYIPAPVLYGLFTKMSKTPEESNNGCILLMTVSVLSIVFLGIAVYY
jgi:sugar phosphate permease